MTEKTSTASSQPIFAGIDGGGSKTAVVILDAAGQELGRGQAAGSNYQAVGLEKALLNLRTALAAALSNAWLPLDTHFAGIVAGLAGIDRVADLTLWQAALDELKLAEQVSLSSDADLILYALPEGTGLGVIAGTGAIAVGRDGRGNRTRASGWGHFFGDEGSGLWLGREALNAASRAADGRGPKTALLPLILKEWGLSQPSDLIGAVYGAGPVDNAKIARLSEVVFKAEAEEDDFAKILVKNAVNELALALKACDTRLLFRDPPGLAVAGGLLLNHPPMLEALTRRLDAMMTLGPVVKVTDPALVAAQAALALAK